MSADENKLIAEIFAREIPEVKSGIIEIKAISRDPKTHSKVALVSLNRKIDCISACVGDHACRFNKIIRSLHGERVDLVRWEASPTEFIANALQPDQVVNLVLDEVQRRAIVTVVRVDKTHLQTAQRREENRSLASRLCGWQIELVEKD